MTSRRTLSKLVLATVVAAGAVTLVPPPATAHVPSPTTHRAARAVAPVRAKVIRLWGLKNRVVVSDTHFRPGAVEFRVRRTSGHGATIAIIRTKNLPLVFKKFGIATSGGPGSADAVKAVDRLMTAYSGGVEGARWQVRLPGGHYYAIDTKTNQVAAFRVKGEPRYGRMRPADTEVWTTPDNRFQTSGPISGPWIEFRNGSHEIHFLEADRVQADVTGADVRKSLKSNTDPTWGLPGGFFFEIESPGVRTVHRQDSRRPRYLLMCWMPSEQVDGMPHAMMGMWHLVDGNVG